VAILPLSPSHLTQEKIKVNAYVINKTYLTFDELATRWGCDKQDIHHLIANEKLVPSFVWNHTAQVCSLEPNASGSGFNLKPCADSSDGTPVIQYPQGWLYLRMPRVVGANDQYYFYCATRDISPQIEGSSPASWYRFLGTVNNGEYQVDAAAIEKNAVFMEKMLDVCEKTFLNKPASLSTPSLIAPPQDNHRSTSVTVSRESTAISGDVMSRIQKAVNAFPVTFPNYSIRSPKLDVDVREWLKNSGLAINDVEKRVFGTILFEHFKLSPNTRKAQK
jgi:hypothetical protein